MILEKRSGYLENKINNLRGFFSLVFGNLSEQDYALFEEKLIECYEEKGITFNDDSLYKDNKITSNFKEPQEMPTLEDLYIVLHKDKKTKNMAIKLKPYVFGSLKFLNKHTNVDLNNSLIVVDIFDLENENIESSIYTNIWRNKKEEYGKRFF